MATRINKFLSEVGYCSRRGADRLIEEGKVTINGKFPEMGTKVEECDHVEVEGKRINKSKKQNPGYSLLSPRLKVFLYQPPKCFHLLLKL